jgi:phage terminase large subunit-like protein
MMMHGGNPVTRWCVDNLGVEIDAAENVKPSKKKSGDKIDGVAALVDALSEAMNEEILQSAYDEEHSLIIA